jgi:transcriptional regulator GlxA family with amidase domain
MIGAMDRADLVRLRRARDRMDREYARPLNVDALARTACMSAGHFSRSFRAALYGIRALNSVRRAPNARSILIHPSRSRAFYPGVIAVRLVTT